MIITIAIDTDEDKDGLKTLEAFVEAFKQKEKFLAKRKDFMPCASVYETARRRIAGERVVCTDKPAPKKRGRKPRNFNQEA